MSDTHPCPKCGADALIAERPGASLRCTRCPWKLVSRAEWKELPPFDQGYLLYMQGSWPTSELKRVRNPYTDGSAEWIEFRRGEQRAVQDAQDGEE